MFMKSLQICFVTLLVSAVAVLAAQPTGPARIQGVVRDSASKPVAGAEVHITAKDGSGLQKIVRTDADGNFGVSKLPVTDYEVVLFVNGHIKATLNDQKVFANKPTQMDFKLTGKYAANNQKKHTHMVYVPAETGSNLSGRWVEVDDESYVPLNSSEVKHLNGAAALSFQRNTGTTGGGN